MGVQSEKFHDFWVYRLAEYFDCRTYPTTQIVEKKRIKQEFADHFTTEKENTSPYLYYQKHGRTMDGNTLESFDDTNFLDDVSTSPQYHLKTCLRTVC